MWTKYAEEITLESADWTDILRGDTISGSVTFEATGTLTCEATQIDLDENNIAKVKLQGGEGGESGFLIATINTDGGQLLRPQYPVKILNRATVIT